MEFVSSDMSELSVKEEVSTKGGMGRRRHNNDDTSVYKSKNLETERRRRQKLSDRLLTLRSLVPIITNMNKATIVEDAITYINELQRNVDVLKDQLSEMEGSSSSGAEPRFAKIDAAEEMKKCGIQEDIQVTDIDYNKFWIKIILEKKRGRISRLIEALNYYGFQLTDISVTTSNGAFLLSSFVERTHGYTVAVQQGRDLLMEVIRSI